MRVSFYATMAVIVALATATPILGPVDDPNGSIPEWVYYYCGTACCCLSMGLTIVRDQSRKPDQRQAERATVGRKIHNSSS